MGCHDINFESEVNFISKNEQVSLHFITQHLDVQVDNCFAVISMTQVFKNQTEKPIEGEYMFPIETTLKNTAVSQIKFKLGDKEIISQVALKEKAKQKYEDAISRGNAAVMVEESEKSKDILKMTVGGIQPQQEVSVTVQILQVLEVESGAYQLRVPQSYFVKYDSANLKSDQQTPYSFKILINSQQDLAYLSIPKKSTVKKPDDLQPQTARKILIEK